ncbi:MAG: hypothetical protein ACRD33_10755, partial [Candidatus Acidiferrales bacterium]
VSHARLIHRDRQIAEPRRLPQKVAAAVVFANQMAGLIIDEEDRNAPVNLSDTLVALCRPPLDPR